MRLLGREENVVEAGGLKSQVSSLKALFSFSFLFRFLASCPLVVSIGELAVTSYILLQESK